MIFGPERGQGTLLMLDSSGSMRGPAGADGKAKIETCDGDPVAAARALKRAGVAVTVDVVGFDIGA